MFRSEVQDTSSISDLSISATLWFDADRIVLGRTYSDQVTAYRARRRWKEALERYFLLEDRLDFNLKVQLEPESVQYSVRCDFSTACGRYAFWRLTHNQAPEVQYMLETAHKPSTPAVCGGDEMQCPASGDAPYWSDFTQGTRQSSLLARCKQWFQRMLKVSNPPLP